MSMPIEPERRQFLWYFLYLCWDRPDRVATQSTKALQSHLKSLRYALKGHADQDVAKQAQDVLQGLDFSNATQESTIVDQVQELMDHVENINVETSIIHRARAANRSLYGEAPCHRDKGSMASSEDAMGRRII